MAKMKDMSTLNSAIKSTSIPASFSNIQKLLGAIASATTALNSLPSEYSRAYAQVQLLKYDANNDPLDVTPEEALSIPNSVIARYKQSWANIQSNIEALNKLLSGQAKSVLVLKEQIGFLEMSCSFDELPGKTLDQIYDEGVMTPILEKTYPICARLFGQKNIGSLTSGGFSGCMMYLNTALSMNPIICKDRLGNVATACFQFFYDATYCTKGYLHVGNTSLRVNAQHEMYPDTRVTAMTPWDLIWDWSHGPRGDAEVFQQGKITLGVITAGSAPMHDAEMPLAADVGAFHAATEQLVDAAVFESIDLTPLDTALAGL